MLLICGIYQACSPEDLVGSIYGVVVESGQKEPLAGFGVELYHIKHNEKSLLLKTVTYDDGSFEFVDLKPGEYYIKVVAAGYNDESTEYWVDVQAGRAARIDMQAEVLYTHISVWTRDPIVDEEERTVTLSCWIDDGGMWSNLSEPTEIGFYYSTNKKYVRHGTKCGYMLTDLPANTYYVISYAINSYGITFGDVKSFTLSDDPIVKTNEITEITYTTAIFNAEIKYVGSSEIIERGFLYSIDNSVPYINDTKTLRQVAEGTTSTYSAKVKNLVKYNTYYVRAYITNAQGTYYGDVLTFVTNPYNIAMFKHNNSTYFVSPDIGEMQWEDAINSCNTLEYADETDWYLPDINELHAMDQNTGMGDGCWSSTPYDADEAWCLYWGSREKKYKYWEYYVRCVRREN